MCGIAGYFGNGAVDETVLMTRLRHRGPDAAGAWRAVLPAGGVLQLVHTRLKIVDLSDASAQPMQLRHSSSVAGARSSWLKVGGPDGPGLAPARGDHGSETARSSLVLVFNGEIYNFRALRAELEALGHCFHSSGDTEVLLRGYAEWGEAVFSRLDGMYALAIFDGPRQRLVLARDHAGIKPLYYARARDGGLIFASEVRALIGSGLIAARVDPIAVSDYLRFGSCQEPRTIVEGVRALRPGHLAFARLDEGSPAALVHRPYWLPERLEVDPDPDVCSWKESHRNLLVESVREQLVADVPLGIFLSGGVDSTLLMELAAEDARERIVAFTLAGRITEHNEGATAMESARRAGVHHLLVQLSEKEVTAWVRDGIGAMDQPSADGINTYLISRAARKEGLVAVLSGAGADELHGAYGHARALSALIHTMNAVGPLRGLLTELAVAGSRWTGRRVRADRLRTLLQALPSTWQAVQERRRFFTPGQASAIWPAGRTLPAGWTPPYSDRESFVARGLREQVRLAEIGGYLLNTLLRDADWATMANQQELRVPFLGRRYMECVLRAPESMTAAARDPKPQLAALLSPAARRLARMPKRGFTVDYLSWLSGPLQAEFGRATDVLRERLGFAVDASAQLQALRASVSQKDARRVWALFALGHYLAALGLSLEGPCSEVAAAVDAAGLEVESA